MGLQLFNNLPIEIKNIEANSFKAKLKEWLVQPAQLIKLTKLNNI